MGAALSRSKLYRHERLEEYNARYFEKVETRNSMHEGHSRTCLQFTRRKHRSRSLAGTTCNQKPKVSQNYVSPQSPSRAIVPESSAHLEKGMEFQNAQPSCSESVFEAKVSPAGEALSHRLQKHRCLQLLFESRESPYNHHTVAFEARHCDANVSSNEDLDVSFESASTAASVWAKIPAESKVTALSMSNIRKKDNSASTQLLLAIGLQNGALRVVEVQDEVARSSMDANGLPPLNCMADPTRLNCQGQIQAIDFSPKGNFIVIGNECGLSLISVAVDKTGFQMISLSLVGEVERLDRVCSARFHPGGDLICFGGYDGRISITSVESILRSDDDDVIPLYEVSRPSLILSIDWSPNGSLLAIGESCGLCTIMSPDLKSMKSFSCPTMTGCVRWNPDGSSLAVACQNVAIIESLNYRLRREIGEFDYAIEQTMQPSKVISICWSPNGRFLAMGYGNGSCLIVESTDYTLVHEIKCDHMIENIAWGQKSFANGETRRYMAIDDGGTTVSIIKAGSDQQSKSDSSVAGLLPECSPGPWVLQTDSFKDIDDTCGDFFPSLEEMSTRSKISCISFSPSTQVSKGSIAFATENPSSITIVSATDFQVLHRFELDKPIRAIAFSPKGSNVAFSGEDGVLYVMCTETGSVVLHLNIIVGASSVHYSSDGDFLSVGVRDGILSIYSTNDGYPLFGAIDENDSEILCHCWSGQHLVVGRQDGSLTIFDSSKVKDSFFVPQKVVHRESPVESMMFDPSGQFLAVIFGRETIEVFSDQLGWSPCFRKVSNIRLVDLSWSPGGRYIIFAGCGTLLLDTLTWVETDRGSLIRDTMFSAKHDALAYSVAWSPDGQLVVFGLDQNKIVLFLAATWAPNALMSF